MTAARASTPAAVLLMGPTGSGKTALALDLARHWPLEIVSVDSANVYRGMDVGTSKPTLAGFDPGLFLRYSSCVRWVSTWDWSTG